ncbi:hypothetical protein HYFRA_00006434 [Hymenoscyphus fraxineus]|uniref:Ricin B lectin domain-containing protein n=1 Tax=Hymenoscyphus fraxineus TaxID=746836 RepID=A0A9N9PLE4_9HELO|nr:hypothetical protein HYFRA_00006434 [Hymenoscyphus fraxineus]
MTTSTSTASSYPGPGVYFLKNVATGTVVDLTNGTLTGRASNFGVTSPSAAQTWQIAAVSSSQVIILNSTTGEYIKAPADNSQNPSAGTGAPSERRSRFEVEARSDGSVMWVPSSSISSLITSPIL